MKIRAKGVRLAVLLAMLLMMLLTAGFAAAAEDPIRVSSLSEPQSVIAPQPVSITIKVYNSSQADMQEKITLYDPTGAPVESYEGLKGEQSVTYQGMWNVTADEIAKGKISYYIQYSVQTESGLKENIRTVPVTIQTEAAAPQLTATYSVSPMSARPGQTVNVSYTLSNTGNVELRSIVIENEAVSKKDVTAVSLSVGEKVTLESEFTMGEKEIVSKPTITYQAAGSTKKLTISDLARKTITVAEDGLEVSVECEQSENIYPGEKVEMTLKLKNTGSRAYTGLNAVGSDGTQIASGVELAPGASHNVDFEIAVTSAMDFTASVTGADSAGEAVGVVSPAVSLTTQDASRALVLNVLAKARETTIYSEPAVIRVAVLVENIGQTDATTLTIEEAGVPVAKIPSLPSGESRTVVFDVQTSMAGKLQFTVSGRDAVGSEKTYESNVIQIQYIEPTPAPTATPSPTPVPPTPTPKPTATPEPTLGERISEAVDPVVLYSAAGVLAALLAVLVSVNVITSARRKKRLAQAIDTIEIEREYIPRDHRGSRRQKGAKRTKEKAEKPKDDENVVATPELTDEEAAMMQDDVFARKNAEAEGRRRRTARERAVPEDATLRVAPVDERPEFIAQGPVDDSQTRIFGKSLKTEELFAEEQESAPEQTIRLKAEEVEEIRQSEEAPQPKSKKKPKELKKKKKGFFSRHKEEDDDLFDDASDYDLDDLGDVDDDFLD